MSDVMERLRAANPVTEEPALPPLGIELGEPARRRRPARRWVLVPALAAVIAVFAGVELRGTDVIAEAREALGGTAGIVHIVFNEQRWNADGTPVPRMGQDLEVWSARDPLRYRMRQPSRAGVPYDVTYANCVQTIENPNTGQVNTERLSASLCRELENPTTSITMPGIDPIPVLRELLASGELTHAGSTDLGGRKVERLVGNVPPMDGSPGARVEYLVDAQTYAPVRLATTSSNSDYRLDFKLYEELPLNAETEQLLVLE